MLVLRLGLVLRCPPFRSELAFSVDIVLIVETVVIFEVEKVVGALEIVVVGKLGSFLGQEFGFSRDLVIPIALSPDSFSPIDCLTESFPDLSRSLASSRNARALFTSFLWLRLAFKSAPPKVSLFQKANPTPTLLFRER
jgi:hypothetical protein